MSTIADHPMAKRQDVAIKVDPEVADLAKIVAAFERKSLARYVSDLLKPLVEDAYLRQIEAATRAAKKPPRR